MAFGETLVPIELFHCPFFDIHILFFRKPGCYIHVAAR